MAGKPASWKWIGNMDPCIYHLPCPTDPFESMDKNKKNDKRVSEATAPPGKLIMPDLSGMSIREASQKLGELGLGMNIYGTGLSTGQSIPANTVVEPGSNVDVYFSP